MKIAKLKFVRSNIKSLIFSSMLLYIINIIYMYIYYKTLIILSIIYRYWIVKIVNRMQETIRSLSSSNTVSYSFELRGQINERIIKYNQNTSQIINWLLFSPFIVTR